MLTAITDTANEPIKPQSSDVKEKSDVTEKSDVKEKSDAKEKSDVTDTSNKDIKVESKTSSALNKPGKIGILYSIYNKE